jgi:hypothetical protein
MPVLQRWVDIELMAAISISHLKHVAKISNSKLEIRYMKDIDVNKRKSNALVYSEFQKLLFRLNNKFVINRVKKN